MSKFERRNVSMLDRFGNLRFVETVTGEASGTHFVQAGAEYM
jgi:hypothetical protein